MHYWRGGFFDFGGIDPQRQIEMSRLADQSQMVGPLYNPSQMVDLSQGYDLSRLDPSQARNFGRPTSLIGYSGQHLLPGEGVIGLFGMFEGDFFAVGGDVPLPAARGLLILGKKSIKKPWKPRVLGAAPPLRPRVSASRARMLTAPLEGETFTGPSRVAISPPKGITTVIQAPRSIYVSGGTRKVPPPGFSANTVYYEYPLRIVVTMPDGSQRVFEGQKFVEIYGGRSSLA